MISIQIWFQECDWNFFLSSAEKCGKNVRRQAMDYREGISTVSDNFMLERWEVKFHSYVFEHGIQFTFPLPCRAKLKSHSFGCLYFGVYAMFLYGIIFL